MTIAAHAGPNRFWNLGANVGAGGVNRLTDVMWVQVLLNTCKAQHEQYPEWAPYDYDYLSYSGQCDGKVVAAIYNVQQYMRAQSPKQTTDGRVNKVPPGTYGYGGSTVWTLLMLHIYLYRYEFGTSKDDPVNDADWNWLMANLWTSSDLPMMLRDEMRPEKQKW